MVNRVDLDEARRIGSMLGVDFNKLDLKEFAEGLVVEQEHSDITGGSLLMAGKIALVHLKEQKRYYTKLRKYVET